MNFLIRLFLFVLVSLPIFVFGQQPPSPPPPPPVQETMDSKEVKKDSFVMPPPPPFSSFIDYMEKKTAGIERPDEYIFDYKLVGILQKTFEKDTIDFFVDTSDKVYGRELSRFTKYTIRVDDFVNRHTIDYERESKIIMKHKIEDRDLDEEWIYLNFKSKKSKINEFKWTGKEKNILGLNAKQLLIVVELYSGTRIEELWVTEELGSRFPYLHDNFTFEDYKKNSELRKYAVLHHKRYYKERPENSKVRFEIIEISPFEKLDVSMYDTESFYR